MRKKKNRDVIEFEDVKITRLNRVSVRSAVRSVKYYFADKKDMLFFAIGISLVVVLVILRFIEIDESLERNMEIVNTIIIIAIIWNLAIGFAYFAYKMGYEGIRFRIILLLVAIGFSIFFILSHIV